MHLSQGLTVDGHHALEDGGGESWPVCALSRVRGGDTFYAVADDVEMAAVDLRRARSRETRQRWAIDRQPSDPRTLGFGLGQPATSPPVARLAAEYEALTALIPEPGPEDWRDSANRNRLRNAMRDLDV